MSKPEIVRIDVMPKDEKRPEAPQKFLVLEETVERRPREITFEELDQELLDLEERKQEIFVLKEQLNEKVFEVLEAMKEGGM